METNAALNTDTSESWRTFEITDGSVAYICLTKSAPGSVGEVVRRKKQRGRPQYQKVEGMLVPASAALATDIPAQAVNLLSQAN